MKVKKLSRIVLKEEFYAITKSLEGALLLSQMCYWSERVYDFDAYLVEQCGVFNNEEEVEKLKSYGWIRKSGKQLSDEMCGAISAKTVSRNLDFLVEMKFLDSKKVKNPDYKFDKCLYYRVNFVEIYKAMKKLGYTLSGYKVIECFGCEEQIEKQDVVPNVQSNGQNVQSTSQNVQSISQNDQPIAETIKETISETIPEMGGGVESARPSCPPDQTQADATAKGRTADAVSKNPAPNCASPLPELENNKANLNRMFKRRDTTRWSAKELHALEVTLGTTDEEWDALIAYYAHAGKEGYFCRNNLITCLNNWAGEIDKARRGKQAVYPKGNESSPSAPKHTPSGHKLSGREEEFWAWLKAWRPYEKRCDIRSVREDYVYDFLNGVVHEPEEPVTEIKLPRVEEDELF